MTMLSDRSLTQRDLLSTISHDCLKKNVLRAFVYLFCDLLAACLLFAAIVTVPQWWIALLLSILLGTVLTGLFVIGHDAGHRAFSHSIRVNNLVGHISMAPVLWPFHIWRLSHNMHHSQTHHVTHEIAWRPAPRAVYLRMGFLQRTIYKYARSSAFFLGSMVFTVITVISICRSPTLDDRSRKLARHSVVFTVASAMFYIVACLWIAGGYGILMLFVIPQMVFHFWLSLFTLLHHTAPDIHFISADKWNLAEASIRCTVCVRYPKFVDLLTHHISWHVAHHVCPVIPHYHLQRAHSELKQHFGDRILERQFSLRYLWSVISTCHLIHELGPDGQQWLDFSELTKGKLP